MHLIILGRRWLLRWVDGREIPGCYGKCDPPDVPGKEIRVQRTLRGTHRAEILIHEMLHAAGWHLDEEFVTQFARDCARNLERTGCLKE